MSDPSIVKLFTCYVPNAPATAAWLREHRTIAHYEQIAAAFSPAAGVRFSSTGNQSSSKRGLIEINISFRYEDYERTCAEFLVVGEQLGFPPGTRLTHTVLDRTTAMIDSTDIAIW